MALKNMAASVLARLKDSCGCSEEHALSSWKEPSRGLAYRRRKR